MRFNQSPNTNHMSNEVTSIVLSKLKPNVERELLHKLT